MKIGGRPHVALAVAVLLLLAAAPIATAAPAGAAGTKLPPSTTKALTALFRSDLKGLGLVVQRGMLENLETNRADPAGTHLALYVAPRSADYTEADYVQNFSALVHRFEPKVFDRWNGLTSFDICQEPFNDPRDEPPPFTQVFVKRVALDRVGNWRKASLRELLAAAPNVRTNADYYTYFSPIIRNDPTLMAAQQAARATTPSTAGAVG